MGVYSSQEKAMAKMDKELAKVAAVLYQLIDENREDDKMLTKLSVITYYFFQYHDAWSEGEGAFFELDEWISLLHSRNEPSVTKMANQAGKDVLVGFPEVARELNKMTQKDS
jgi:iron-sulfur cluster repair protein YtfE (RIC family)